MVAASRPDVAAETLARRRLAAITVLRTILISVIACAFAVTASAATPTPRFLTSGGDFIDYWPCFSPDGKSVLFSRSTDGGRSWELWIVDVSGTNARKFARAEIPVSQTSVDAVDTDPDRDRGTAAAILSLRWFGEMAGLLWRHLRGDLPCAYLFSAPLF